MDKKNIIMFFSLLQVGLVSDYDLLALDSISGMLN